MPTLQGLNIPTPRYWEEFEDICLSSFKLKWNSPNLTKNGRQGQAQHGVDIYGEDNLGVLVGIQCKKYNDELTEKVIEKEISNAEKFTPQIKAFYFATTAPSDAKTQSAIRVISANRVAADKFPVGIFFWCDIIHDLANNESVFLKHFPQLKIKTAKRQPGQRSIAIFDLVYYGTNFHQSMHLLFGEVDEDPNQLRILCKLLSGACIQLFDDKEQADIISDLNFIENYVMPWVTGLEDRPGKWEPVIAKVRAVEKKIINLKYQLTNNELGIFTLATKLANWDRSALHDKPLNEKDEKLIKRLTKKLFGKHPKDIRSLIDKYKQNQTVGVVMIPFKCFVICKNLFLQKQFFK